MARKKDGQQEFTVEKILRKPMDEVMHTSMMPYAEYVILERALPRVEDGLKPVQRRILYTMNELGVTPDKPHKKSARIVGDTLGKYHPHGDTSVYDAMVRLAQPFNMQMPLVDGHGNFGTVDGDSAAAMRYTEARLAPLAMEMLRDIDDDTVKFSLNFDDSLKEPDLLPGRYPNLLVNGSSGIAVGLATNIPPHNMAEAIDAVIAVMDSPDITVKELMRVLPCPDFPTGAFIIDSPEIETAYSTGRGKLTMRAKTHIEEGRGGRKLIVVDELPFQVNKAKLLGDILKATQEKKLLFSGVSDIRDESDKDGMRAVIEVKKDADAEKTLRYLYKYSVLQCTFGVNMVAIADGKPQQLSVKSLINHYIRHQEDVITRRTQHRLDACERRAHILDGLMIAILNIDEVIALIRASKTPKEAKEGLMKRFELSEAQAQAILDLRLQRLTNLELLAIEKESRDVAALMGELKAILASRVKLRNVIKRELREIRDKYSVPRRTVLLRDENTEITVDAEDLKVVEDVVIALLPEGKMRRIPKRSFAPELVADERPVAVMDTATDRSLNLFTDAGSMIRLPVEDIPESKAGGKPTNLTSLIELEKGESVVAVFGEMAEGELMFYTDDGFVKRTAAAEYVTRNRRVAAVNLRAGARVIGVETVKEDAPVLLVTAKGMSIRFTLDSVPQMGRATAGVRGIKLESGDSVVFASMLPEEGEVLTISDRGYAKRSFVFDHDLQGRYGKGQKAFDFKKNGSNGTCIAAVFHVMMPFTVQVVQKHGAVTELYTEDVLIEPRVSRGRLTVMTILDDVVVSAHRKL